MELDFRVWDILNKRYIYSNHGYQGHYTLSLTGKFYNLQNGSGGNEYIVQQYTGVKDSNGDKIYLGDILNIDILDLTLYSCVVEFKNGSFIVRPPRRILPYGKDPQEFQMWSLVRKERHEYELSSYVNNHEYKMKIMGSIVGNEETLK